jgi:hypothetical protein
VQDSPVTGQLRELTGDPGTTVTLDRDELVLLPVRRGRRITGVFVARDGRIVYRPAFEADHVLAAAVLLAGAAAVAVLRGRPAIGRVSMGPGGWVSVKGAPLPQLRGAEGRRPWWARLLSAHRLVAR